MQCRLARGETRPCAWSTGLVARDKRIDVIDPLTNINTAVFSPNGSLVASQNALGYCTSMILDGARQRICLVDANGGRTSTVFDPRGLVLSTQDPLNALTSFQFDQAGNTILRTDALQCARGKAAPKSCTLVHDLVRLTAHVSSGLKSRQEELCEGYTSCRQRQPLP